MLAASGIPDSRSRTEATRRTTARPEYGPSRDLPRMTSQLPQPIPDSSSIGMQTASLPRILLRPLRSRAANNGARTAIRSSLAKYSSRAQVPTVSSFARSSDGRSLPIRCRSISLRSKRCSRIGKEISNIRLIACSSSSKNRLYGRFFDHHGLVGSLGRAQTRHERYKGLFFQYRNLYVLSRLAL